MSVIWPPHFEKMLYDNTLLIMAYCQAYAITKKPLYLDIAEKTAAYILREVMAPEGGFYCAQDADSEGEEGKYYLFTPEEILRVLGKNDGKAFCRLYQVSEKAVYLDAAKRADRFLAEHLMESDALFVSFRKENKGVKGFLDDYAACIFAQLALHGTTLDKEYFEKAKRLCREADRQFRDKENGGYFFYGADNESLVLQPKETYDGAIPSGNALMAWNLVRLSLLTGDEAYEQDAQRQLGFLAQETAQYPTGHAMFLLALLNHENPPCKVVVVPADETDVSTLPLQLPMDAAITLLEKPTEDYPLKKGKTTFYICRGHSCLHRLMTGLASLIPILLTP